MHVGFPGTRLAVAEGPLPLGAPAPGPAPGPDNPTRPRGERPRGRAHSPLDDLGAHIYARKTVALQVYCVVFIYFKYD